MNLTHGGLFEGYGGTTLAAAEVLGPLESLWFSDIKPASRALLAHRYRHVPNLGDVRTIDYDEVEHVDILTASWPCQPESLEGKLLGEGDPRALWPEVRRAVAALRPQVFLGENVARIATNGALSRVVRDLDELGYAACAHVVPASRVGAPHRRERCFVVAVDLGEVELLDHLNLDPLATWPLFDPTEKIKRLPTPEEKLARSGADYARARRPLSGGDDLTTAVARIAMFPEVWETYQPALKRWEDIVERDAPVPHLPSLRKPYNQQLNPRFVEWIMGLPDGWVCDAPISTRPHGMRGQALSLLGDGVVPQQGAYAFAQCLRDLVAGGAS